MSSPLSWITVVWLLRAGKGAFGIQVHTEIEAFLCLFVTEDCCCLNGVPSLDSCFTFYLQMKELHCLVPPVFLTWLVMASLPETSVPGIARPQVPCTWEATRLMPQTDWSVSVQHFSLWHVWK